MKINEVPQDEAYMIKGKIRDLCYAVDKDGRYTSTLSMGWKPKNEALNQAWEQVYEKVEEKRQGVLKGKLSPIAFYMELNLMNPAILADYIGIAKWRVRKHLKMKNFKKLKPELLEKYAGVLNVTPEELTDPERIRSIVITHGD